MFAEEVVPVEVAGRQATTVSTDEHPRPGTTWINWLGSPRSFRWAVAREGASKIVETCSYPLTGVGCVTRVYTDKAVFLRGPNGVSVRETFGCTLEELQALVPVPLKAAPLVHRDALKLTAVAHPVQ